MNNDLISYRISIIVPIYNVDTYLKQCLDSIVNQSYTNLEIILVDDGSTDTSNRICDEYARQDARIKVLHKENGGLSGAKNAGLDAATGDLIIFVDGDDFISPDMLKIMITNLMETGSDIVICDYFMVESDQCIPTSHNFGNKKIFGTEEAMALVLSEKINSFSWDKLCKSHLYKKVRFPVGLTFEDIHETYKLFIDCKKVSYVEECLYYYRINSQGISMSSNPRNLYNIFLGFKKRLEFAKTTYPDSLDICTKFAVDTAMNIYNRNLFKLPIEISQSELEELVRYIKENKKLAMLSRNISKKQKIRISLLCMNRKIYDTLNMISRKSRIIFNKEI